MSESKKLQNGKGKAKGQEGRVTLRIRNELLEELQGLADKEELNLSAYVRQLLKHEIINLKRQEGELAPHIENKKILEGRNIDGSRRRLAG